MCDKNQGCLKKNFYNFNKDITKTKVDKEKFWKIQQGCNKKQAWIGENWR